MTTGKKKYCKQVAAQAKQGRITRRDGLRQNALHDALTAALERWTKDRIPANPRAWLVSTGRFKAIDAMRRRARFDASQEAIAEQLETTSSAPAGWDDESEAEYPCFAAT
jgi:RNA polymerase sigma-70 factor (ECF subfamily)